MEKNTEHLTEKWAQLMAKEKQAKQLLQELQLNEVTEKEQPSIKDETPKNNFDNLLGCGG